DTIPVIPDGTLTLDTISHFIVNVASNNSLWIDSDVYINNSFPINPPTIGVVTFDGLKGNGLAYVPGLPNVVNQRGIADYLTSKPIDLRYTAADSVHFSFYFQPQGTGNAPEGIDSLVVEFYSPVDSLWKHQWSLGGRPVQDFQQVVIPITDTMFLKNGFQFRFKNYADLSGNLDHWNVDYVRLFAVRNRANPHPEDIAFNRPSSILLKNYRQMPWNQYVANPANEMNRDLSVYVRNNSANPLVLTYTFNIKDQAGVVLATQSSSDAINPLTSKGYTNNIGINFPTSTANFNQFTVENYMNTPTTDVLKANDTLRHIQKFDNFYAYDDGVPEAGYGLNMNGAKLACQFVANTPDDVTSVRIHFTPVNVQSQIYPFLLTIWSSLNPETIIYQDQSFSYPSHPATELGFAEYFLPEPVRVSGNFYVGMVQVSNVELNIGFDKSFSTKDRIFYNLNGNWINTIFNGSLMIRPVLGPSNDPTVGIVEQAKPKATQLLKVYPNPARDRIFIEGITETENTSLSIYDLYGRTVIQNIGNNLSNVDISGLSEGMYILKVENKKTGLNHTSKIMVNR
ncbi:MAG: T9SS type A sorting domain-containing protein, partial [Bacteroidetes bacterium]|nr:T9SS type A sorting domain-containing protein [Bacteroidota bacterium]